MSNDNGLVDEFEKLQNLKKEIDEKIEKIRNDLILLAEQKNTDILFGTNKKCSIRGYEKVIYPKDKTQIIEIIRRKGMYEKFSSINYLKLSPAIIKGETGQELLDLIKKEKAFRLSFANIEK